MKSFCLLLQWLEGICLRGRVVPLNRFAEEQRRQRTGEAKLPKKLNFLDGIRDEGYSLFHADKFMGF